MCLPPLLGFERRKAETPEDQGPCGVKGIEVDATHPKLEAFLVAQTMKNLPAMQEAQARSVGREDPLEKEMATHYRIPAWEIPWTEEPGRLPWGCKELDMAE